MDTSGIFGKPSQRYTDGYHHQSKRVLIVVSSMLHVSAYSAMRVIPSAMLMYARPVVFRMCLRPDVHFYGDEDMERNVSILSAHVKFNVSFGESFYVLLHVSRALFVMRMPYFNITGRGYTCLLLYGYIDAFAMLFAAGRLVKGTHYSTTISLITWSTSYQRACAHPYLVGIIKSHGSRI